ncbi:MAG TPA: hypothetical protein VNO30_41985, partial [Kofleriaceae bacterium]|nr:hypothetical protein [Kofleriaceae bacterium]
MGVVVAVVGSSAAFASPPNADVPAQDFGAVRLANAATTTVTRTFDITNTGTQVLTIDAVAITGTNAGDFTLMSGPAAGT